MRLTFATRRSQAKNDHIIIHKHDDHFNITIGDNLSIEDQKKAVDTLYCATEQAIAQAPLVVQEVPA
jgi:hypothetical protein